MAKRAITKGGTRGTAFRDAGFERMLDAKKLREANRLPGAIYLAGYAVECHLKYSVCQAQESVYLPKDLETHDWDRLLAASGLRPSLTQNLRLNALFQDLVERWTTSLRYNPQRSTVKSDPALYEMTVQLYQFLRETVP